MAKRVARNSKTTKTRKSASVIRKGGDRLRARERKTLLAMAKVLAGKLQ